MQMIIYGAGDWGRKAYLYFTDKEPHEILFFVDGNPERQNDTLFGKKILRPEILLDYPDAVVVVAAQNNSSMKDYLAGIGHHDVLEYNPSTHSLYPQEVHDRYDAQSTVYWSDNHETKDYDKPYSCTSQVCRQSFWDMPFFEYWAKRLMPNLIDHLRETNQFSERAYEEPILYHRKLWEWVYVCQSLYERGCLRPGKKGLAFGIGKEGTADLFASLGCDILATDLSAENDGSKIWLEHSQNAAGNIGVLNKYGFCDKETFAKKVSYRDVDMNHIDEDLKGYDFCWSACALEHLGGLRAGMDFVKNSLRTLNGGGVAVHTTEYNLTSNDRTIDEKTTAIYRKKDILRLAEELRNDGHFVAPLDFYCGSDELDKFVDIWPHGKKDMHVHLAWEGQIYTSIGLIIVKKADD